MTARLYAVFILAVLGIGSVRAEATASSAPSGEYLFRMLDTSSGLPDNNVRNMTMLPDGLMCIQTSTMLNLYNGASCKSYKYNPINIPYTEYSGLNNSYFDRAENLLWCTSRDHIWIFNLNTRCFEYDITGRLSRQLLGSHGRCRTFQMRPHLWRDRVCGASCRYPGADSHVPVRKPSLDSVHQRHTHRV